MTRSKAQLPAEIVYECVGTDLVGFEAEDSASTLVFDIVPPLEASDLTNCTYEAGIDAVHSDSADDVEDADVGAVTSDGPTVVIGLNDSSEALVICEPPEQTWFKCSDVVDAKGNDLFVGLTEHVRQHAHDQGFGVAMCSIRRTKAGRLSSGKFICDRGYAPSNYRVDNPEVVKQGSTRNNDCPFVWRISIKNGKCSVIRGINVHNHPTDLDELLASPGAYKLKAEHVKYIADATALHVRPAIILDCIREKYKGLIIKIETIYVTRRRLKIAGLGNNTHIQCLLDYAVANNFAQDYEIDSNGNLLRLFFSPLEAVQMARWYPDVLVMDCTYKTNHPQVPLLNVVGISATGATFFAGFVFMARETAEDYKWALRQIKRFIYCDKGHPGVISTDCDTGFLKAISVVFPQSASMLCQWHIKENLRRHYVKPFTKELMDDLLLAWDNVVHSHSVELFESNWALLCADFEECSDVVSYLSKQWMPYKKHFVVAWTKRYLHLGTGTSQRVESAHSGMKRTCITTSTHGLNTVATLLVAGVRARVAEIKKDIVTARTTVLSILVDNPFFAGVRHRISHKALLLAYNQYLLAFPRVGLDEVTVECTGILRQTMGIPCVHELRKMLQNNEVLVETDFHMQWHLAPSLQPATTTEDARMNLGLMLQGLNEYSRNASGSEALHIERAVHSIVHGPIVALQNPITPKCHTAVDIAGTYTPSKKKGCSTRREPTGAEHAEREKAESTQPSSTVYRGRPCGACGERTHNSGNHLCPRHPCHFR